MYKHIQEWKTQQFKSECGRTIEQQQQILLTICHIKFTNLKLLDLSYCGIKSLEPITWMNIKSVQKINLCRNHILKLKPFSKTNFTRLQTISTIYNPFRHYQQSKCLSRAKLSDKYNNKEMIRLVVQSDQKLISKSKINKKMMFVKFCHRNFKNLIKYNVPEYKKQYINAVMNYWQ